MHLFPDLLEEHPAIGQASNTPKEESVVGPLGFEPRTDGLKVSGSSLKTAGAKHLKNARNCRFQLKTAGKTQVSGHLPDTKYDKYDAYEKGGNAGSQAKRAHMC